MFKTVPVAQPAYFQWYIVVVLAYDTGGRAGEANYRCVPVFTPQLNSLLELQSLVVHAHFDQALRRSFPDD
jgi:hypothetical protein